MAGFRTFATGEVLTAANVNDFLMKQSVMVFADAAARTAALGAEVAEGMLTYNEDTAQLEVFDGSAFVPAGAEPPAGIGSNVATVTLATTLSLTIAGGATGVITGLTVNFTPTSATSKALVIGNLNVSANSTSTGRGMPIVVKRDGTPVGAGNADGSRLRATVSTIPVTGIGQITATFAFVDSPATTSQVTYTVELGNGTDATGFFINRTGNNSNGSEHGLTGSSLTVVEVAV